MRIVLTTESYLPYLSGVTVSVDALARGLGAMGHEVVVVAPRPADGSQVEPVGSPGPAPQHAWLRSYQPLAIAPPWYRMPVPNPWAAAAREARAFAPDLVHAHSPFVTGLLARRLAGSVGAPLVFTHHTRFADYAHYAGPLATYAGRLTDAYLRRFWRACAAIVAPSDDLGDAIRAGVDGDRPERVHVIPTGVDVAAIRASTAIDARRAAGWPVDAVIVASLGRLAPEKSPEILLEAFARAATREARLRLLVVGGGPSEARLRARAISSAMEGRVLFTGSLLRPAALAWIAGADILLFTSRTETQGLVLAEALSAGVPAIAVEGPGVRDSVRDGVDGIVVPFLPSGSLVERLSRTVSDLAHDHEGRRAMAQRARADADRFAVERRVGQVEALYRTLALARR
ncbi:MAG: glycosyltransferase [Chloroflexota bacterium]|nr:glycosyltransferase [Chloroflexota bacterium]